MMYWSGRDQVGYPLVRQTGNHDESQVRGTWLHAALQRREDVVEEDWRHHVVDRHLDSASGAELWTDHAAHVRQPTSP